MANSKRLILLHPISRTKMAADSLSPDFSKIKQLCERIGSTGLYPYAISDRNSQVFDARQFNEMKITLSRFSSPIGLFAACLQ
jgi:hypothetical protein